MRDIAIKTATEAEQALHRASCIVLSLEQLIRHTQCEEPFCAAAVSETLTVAYEQIIGVMSYLEQDVRAENPISVVPDEQP